MLVFEGRNIPKLYTRILEKILQEGVEVGPRGLKTKELSPVTMISFNPQERLFGHPTRKEVSIFTYIEGLWILLGEATPDRLVHYVKNMVHYVNKETGEFDGAYGPRIRKSFILDTPNFGYLDQLDLCYKRLKEDSDSRRAIVVINQPYHDWNTKSLDIPCTIMYQFLIRRRALDMITYMRSQDAWLGLVYDTGEFSWFQEIMAGWLGLDVGTYTHIDGSLHLYEKHWKKAEQLINEDKDWDLYSQAEVLDARLNKEEYDETERVLGLWEEACRINNFSKVETKEVEEWEQRNDFYNNLLDVIYAYNARLRGEKEVAYNMIRYNRSDLGLIYRKRWGGK